MMDGLLGKMVRWFEYLSGEVAIVLLLPLVLFFLFLVIIAQSILVNRENG